MAMPVKIEKTSLDGVLCITSGRAADNRGYFSELWSAEVWKNSGIKADFLQDNLSRSAQGTLRGLHYQIYPEAQGKLVHCLDGSIFDVAVDIRRNSDTYGKWTGHKLSADNHKALWIPPGFAHGFLVLEPDTLVLYKCSGAHYAPKFERSVHYADPDIGIDWPIQPELINDKDQNAPFLKDAETNFSI